MRALLTVLIAVAAPVGLASEVFRCPSADGSLVYQQSPCQGGAPVQLRPESPDVRPTGGVRLSGQRCADMGGGNYTSATGYVVNGTPEPISVDLTTTFVGGGQVIDTMTHRIDVSAWGRAPFQMVGGPARRIKSCEWQWRRARL